MSNTINANGIMVCCNGFPQSAANNLFIGKSVTDNNDSSVVAYKTDFMSAIKNKSEVRAKNTDYVFKGELKAKYPGAYYNVMDTSKIDHGLWGRNDYPWDAYFSEPANSSVLNWTPTGAEPTMQDSSVVSKINSIAGKLAMVIPPELERRMQNDEELTQKVMDHVDGFVSKYYRSDTNQGFLITFDENGEIGESCIVCEGKMTVSSSEFVEERKARERKAAEYERIAKENAIKQKIIEKDRMEKEYRTAEINKAILSYSNAGIIE